MSFLDYMTVGCIVCIFYIAHRVDGAAKRVADLEKQVAALSGIVGKLMVFHDKTKPGGSPPARKVRQ